MEAAFKAEREKRIGGQIEKNCSMTFLISANDQNSTTYCESFSNKSWQ